MSYTPFNITVIPILIYYIFLSIFGFIVTILMFLKWRERKVVPPLYLTVVFASLTIALIGLSIGLSEAIITGFYKEIYRFSLPFGYIMVIVADIFLYRFSSHIIDKGKKYFPFIILIGILIVVFLALPWNWWGVPSSDYEGQLNIRLFSTLGMLLYSYFIFIYIAYISYKTKSETEDKVARMGFSMLFYSMISIMLLFLMLTADTVLIAFTDHPGYSGFTYIAWIFGIIFIILIYLSLIMPEWLIKWIKKRVN